MRKKRKPTLGDLVNAAHKVGVKVTCSLESTQMPIRFPNDPEPVRMLLDESERVSKLGNDWLNAKVPNQVAANAALTQGWAHALAAAWLRCKLKGELK